MIKVKMLKVIKNPEQGVLHTNLDITELNVHEFNTDIETVKDLEPVIDKIKALIEYDKSAGITWRLYEIVIDNKLGKGTFVPGEIAISILNKWKGELK